MATTCYDAKLNNGILYLRFQNTIVQKHRNRLKELGFSYCRKLNCWTGDSHHAEALKLAQEASHVTSRDLSQKPTLCWNCFHSDKGNASKCTWARDFIPVDGWIAEPTYERKSAYAKSDNFDKPVSYRVDECPMFQADDS